MTSTSLQAILNMLTIGVNAASALTNSDTAVGEAFDIAGALTAIAQAANQAHIDVAGKPIDLTQLRPYVPVD